MLGWSPLRTLVRAGLHSGTWVTARSKVVPISARRSMFGVLISGAKCPQLLTVRMSSIENMRKFFAATSGLLCRRKGLTGTNSVTMEATIRLADVARLSCRNTHAGGRCRRMHGL